MGDKWVALADNLLDVQCATPVELIPHHVLRKPSVAERDQFRDTLKRACVGPLNPTLRFESEVEVSGDKPCFRQTEDPEAWRYWVVAADDGYSGANDGVPLLERLSRLTEVEMRFLLHLSNQPGFRGVSIVSYGGGPAVTRYLDLKFPQPFTDRNVQMIRELYAKLQKIEQSHPRIYRAIVNFDGLGASSSRQDLYILGVFAVIESVLTHDPRGGYDSLTHQVGAKMKLLSSRFAEPLDDSAFGGCSFGKLWKLLYSFRSCIAHGSDPDFGKELNVLKDINTAKAYIDQAAKKLLRQALAEPQLITDLQQC